MKLGEIDAEQYVKAPRDSWVLGVMKKSYFEASSVGLPAAAY